MSDHSNKRLEGILEDEDKLVSRANGTLSRLWRQILADQGVTWPVWNRLMDDYLNNPRNRVPRHSRGRSSTRGNLNKELSKPNMTWNNLIKGIILLNPVRAKFTMEFKWRRGTVTSHSVVFGREDDTDENEDN